MASPSNTGSFQTVGPATGIHNAFTPRTELSENVKSHRRSIESFLGSSQAIRRVRTFARKAARVRAPVLILGETGTGKSLLGRMIHGQSSRGGHPFVSVNCAAIPDALFESEFFGHEKGAFTGAQGARQGLLEQAEGGTLFLDELGELDAPHQAKLLTAIEEGEVRRLGATGTVRVEVRVMAATSRDLPQAMERGDFRRDLYHRVAVLTCHLPPLRERPEDITILARHLLRLHRGIHGGAGDGLSRDVLEYLEARPWPGNVRELSHLLEAAVILAEGRPVNLEALEAAASMARGAGRREAMTGTESWKKGEAPSGWAVPGGRKRYAFQGGEEEERSAICSALERARGNKTVAARDLGMARSTLRTKLRKHGLV